LFPGAGSSEVVESEKGTLIRRSQQAPRSVIDMLSQTAIDFLSPLTYQVNAKRQFCFLPLGGIYWEDEIPDHRALLNLPERERNMVYRLFSIRFKIWNGEKLSAGDQNYWDEARMQVPKYALFQRLRLSDEDRQAQETVERELLKGFDELIADADEIKKTDNEQGMWGFSATFEVAKDETK
jgi:hypothetical protein